MNENFIKSVKAAIYLKKQYCPLFPVNPIMDFT
jgi:hypothetical protein